MGLAMRRDGSRVLFTFGFLFHIWEWAWYTSDDKGYKAKLSAETLKGFLSDKFGIKL